MVFFTCNHCGSSLKKNRVEKHYSTECHANPSLSCMDCQKDFYGEDFKSHTKCISEDQKYSGKPLHDTSSVGKGEKKQLQWVETVRQIIETKGSSLTSQERNMLESMKDYENIPRKKKKFENFVRNVMRGYTEQRTIDRVWALLEEHKPVAPDTKQNVHNKGNEGTGEKVSEEKAITDGIASEEKPQKTEVNSKKKLKRNAISPDDDAVGNEEQVASKKKKKRKMTEDVEMLEADQGTAEEETNVDRVEAEKEDGGDATCTSEETVKLSKKERKEKKKKEKYEAELQSIANGANEKEEIVEEEDDSKSKKKKKKNIEEKADVVEEVDGRKKKEKKRKHKESQGEDVVKEEKQDENKTEDVQGEATEKDVEEPVNGVTQVSKGKFKWEKTIVSALQAAPENELLIKRLRKKVLAEYQDWQSSTSAHGISTLEEAYGTFDRKLHRIPSVKVLKDRVKLLKISD